jgi:hypothetical protein
MNVDGSVTPQRFRLPTPPPGEVFLFNLFVWTSSNTGIDWLNNFMGLPQLLNGVSFSFEEGISGIETNFGARLFRTLDFQVFSPEPLTVLKRTTIGPPAPWAMSIRWDLTIGGYVPILRNGDEFDIIINDDLTGMLEFTCFAQGRVVEE